MTVPNDITRLDQSPEAVAKRADERRVARNRRRHLARKPVRQKPSTFVVLTSYRALRPKLIDGTWITRDAAPVNRRAISAEIVPRRADGTVTARAYDERQALQFAIAHRFQVEQQKRRRAA